MKKEEDWLQLRQKRLTALCGCWDLLCSRSSDLAKNTRLVDQLAAEVVEQYVEDYRSLVGRYRIEDKIQRHRVAGLMVGAILQRKPINLRDPTAPGARISRHNEFLAAWHGLAICSERATREKIEHVRNLPKWSDWFQDLVYFMKRNPAGEDLAMVFGTISLLYFGDDDQAE